MATPTSAVKPVSSMKRVPFVKNIRAVYSAALGSLAVGGRIVPEAVKQIQEHPDPAERYILVTDETGAEIGRCGFEGTIFDAYGSVAPFDGHHFFDWIGAVPTAPKAIVLRFPSLEQEGSSWMGRITVEVRPVDPGIATPVMEAVRSAAEGDTNGGAALLKLMAHDHAALFWTNWLRIPENMERLAPDVLADVADSFKRWGCSQHAILLLRRLFPRKVDPSSRDGKNYGVAFDVFCRTLKFNDEAAALCRQDVATNGETYWSMTNLGHCHYRRGEKLLAEGLYLLAQRNLTKLGRMNYHANRSVISWRPRAFVELLDGLSLAECEAHLPERHLEMTITPHPEAQFVHMVPCDDGYFGKYGRIMIDSSIGNADIPIAFHVHVCNPSDATRDYLVSFKQTERVSLSYSFERRDPPHATRGYFSNMRYLLIPWLLDAHAKPVFVSDMDAKLICPWSNIASLMESGDILLSDNNLFSRLMPWSVPAAIAVFMPTPFGRRFADLVAKYTALVLDFSGDPDANWGLDLSALGAVFDYLVTEEERHRIVPAQLKRILMLANYAVGGKAAFVQMESRPA